MLNYEFDVKKHSIGVINFAKDWFNKNGDDKTIAIVGISGGKDSAVVCKILVEALGTDRVIGVLLPSGNQVDIEDSYKVVNHLKVKHLEINIKNTYDTLTNSISSAISSDMTCDLDYKNLKDFSLTNLPNYNNYTTNTPARIRMTILYAIGSIIGNTRVANTCQLSEDITSYSTLWGDSVGDFSLLGLLTTTEVIAIGDYLGLPREITHKTPTDGMSLNSDGTLKTDESKLGFSYEEVNELIRKGIKGPSYDSIMKKFNAGKFKMQIIRMPHYEPKLPNYFENLI